MSCIKDKLTIYLPFDFLDHVVYSCLQFNGIHKIKKKEKKLKKEHTNKNKLSLFFILKNIYQTYDDSLNKNIIYSGN